MARRRRERTPGLVFHVVNRAAKRSVLFHETSDYAAFERLLAEAVGRLEIALFAYCIMPNHWHLVLTPKVAGGLSRFMHWMTTTHARRWQNIHGSTGQGAVYQGRFKAIPIGTDGHFLWVCRYVERNPLRASLVQRAEEWRWSSLHTDTSSWLAEWPIARPSDWLSNVNTPQTDGELEQFRHAVRVGQPYGDAEWVQNLRIRGDARTPRARGRPRRLPTGSVL